MDAETEYSIIAGDFRSEPVAKFKLKDGETSYSSTQRIEKPTNVIIRASGESYASASALMETGQDLIVTMILNDEDEVEKSYGGTAAEVAQLMDDIGEINNKFFETHREKEQRQYSLSLEEYRTAFAAQSEEKLALVSNIESLSDDMKYILETDIWASTISSLNFYQMYKNRVLKEGEEKVIYPEVAEEMNKIYQFDERALYSQNFSRMLATTFSELAKDESDEVITYGNLYLRAEEDKKTYNTVIADPNIPSFMKEKALSTMLIGNASYPSSPLSASLELKDQFLKDFPESKFASDVEAGYAKWERLKKGVSAPNFTLEDQEGQMVSLSDFKGNVVYIDVWATWCGPCIKEFDYAKDIKAEFKNVDDVIFMYVSIDRLEDKDTWKTDLVKHGLAEGVNLFANGPDSEFVEKYNRTGIPRYILIDKDGTIHDAKTFRPSSTEILINEIQKLRGVSLDKALSMR